MSCGGNNILLKAIYLFIIMLYGMLQCDIFSALWLMELARFFCCRSLLEMAKASPLNATEEGPAWKDVLAPRMATKAKL